MDIEKELIGIISKKDGNKELALFYNRGYWELHLGNPTNCVSLGEVSGEIETEGKSIFEVIEKMKNRLENKNHNNI